MRYKPRHKRKPKHKKLTSSNTKGKRRYTGFVETLKNRKARVHCDQFDTHVFIPAGDNLTIGDGDIVEFVITSSFKELEGKITKVIKHVQTEFVAEVISKFNTLFVVLDNGIVSKIKPSVAEKLKLKPNLMVLVEVQRFEKPVKLEIVEILGDKNSPHVSLIAIARKNGFKEEFSKEALDELTGITSDFIEVNSSDRVDLRSEKLFTVDPTDAKDFDDAITISRKDEGYQLGVHIADVSAFVYEGSNLDSEAYERGFSLYLPSSVIPMLPKKLSNYYCSLNPNTDRLAFSCLMELDNEARVTKYAFKETVVNSKKRFDYKGFQECLERVENGKDLEPEYRDFSEEILLSAELKRKLKRNRVDNGSIDFDLVETKVELDKEGNTIGIFPYKTYEANEIIEEFMLIANRCAADFMLRKEKQLSGVYRIHEEPSEERVNLYLKELGNNGIKIKRPNDILDHKFLQSVIEKVKNHEQGDILIYNFLRSMKKAKYSIENSGHYGLAFDRYTHFTSPIRRYSDLMVHRIIKKHIRALPIIKKQDKPSRVEERCKFISLREVKSIKAEYNARDLKIAEFIAKKKGSNHNGVISSVSPHGFYVRLNEFPVEGLVHIKSLKDHFLFIEDERMLKGKKSGKVYHSGMPVNIKIKSVDMDLLNIDFLLNENS
ncbi:MAG: ribonuclease R [Candidatus Cloacimonadota bacterium]|nr:MAG: ribonuclease R [Candidatus Cloacimonadota bacterium]PIE77735.1 MAG: ribonuclease R [Candidatus Delongbacteria bacterium]